MFKKITLCALALVFATQPLLPSAVNADPGIWNPPQVEAVWTHDDYRVERLALTHDTIGPISLGDLVLVADPADSCKPGDCDVYHVTLLKDGMAKTTANVPAELIDETRFRLNGDRLVYVTNLHNSDERFTVVELDDEFNTSQVLVDDVFFTNTVDLSVMVDGTDVYLNPEFANNDFPNGYLQKAVYVWDPKTDTPDIIGKHYVLRRENLVDVQNKVALANWEFEKGNEQLWFMNTVDENNRYFEAVPGTWTEPEGDIVGAHFTSGGAIEYFQYFVRFTYDPAVDEVPVRHEETLTWYRDIEDALQISGDRMAWVNAEDRLYVSDGRAVTDLGIAPGGIFTLEQDRIFYATPEGGAIYAFATGTKTDLDFGVTDVQGDVVVGVDQNGNVLYQNLASGDALKQYLGKGSDAVISDEYHVYWRGEDGIYEATIFPTAQSDVSGVTAIKTADSPMVYLVDGAERWAIPSEKAYFTWFDSWNEVKTVSEAELSQYADKGVAKFAPGTKVKLFDDPKVYVVGSDGKLHWITTQAIAYTVYGSTWNKNIVEATQSEMIGHSYGTMVTSEADYLTI